MESILTSIKKLLGISKDDTSFDGDIIVHINTVLFELYQIGVGPSTPFSIEGEEDYWDDFVTTDYQAVKTYVYLKVRLLFDPPTNSSIIESFNKSIDRLEWRLNVAADKTE